MELILIRHGESHFNTKDTQNLDSPLTTRGRQQCFTCGAFLRRKFGIMTDWEGLVSPFFRTLQTAEILDRYIECGFKIEWKAREFAHISSGYKGVVLNLPCHKDKFPDYFPEDMPNDYIFTQEEETNKDLVDRVSEFVAELQNENGKYVIVSHGQMIYTMIYVMNGNYQVPIWDKRILNTSVTYFKDDRMVYFARYVNGGKDPRGESWEYVMI